MSLSDAWVPARLRTSGDTVDELHRCGVCARCTLRFLGETNELVYGRPAADLERAVAASIAASQHSRAFLTEPIDNHGSFAGSSEHDSSNSIDSGHVCPMCFGTLQRFHGALADQLTAAIREARYRNVRACDIQLSLPPHTRIRHLAMVAHLRTVSNLRRRAQLELAALEKERAAAAAAAAAATAAAAAAAASAAATPTSSAVSDMAVDASLVQSAAAPSSADAQSAASAEPLRRPPAPFSFVPIASQAVQLKEVLKQLIAAHLLECCGMRTSPHVSSAMFAAAKAASSSSSSSSSAPSSASASTSASSSVPIGTGAVTMPAPMLHISVVVALGAAAEAAIGTPAYRLLSTIEHGSAAIVVGENGKTNVNDPKRVCTS
jgi:hypothetical protein